MVTRKVSEPVQDALKAYLELALGLTEASKKKAEKAVKKMAKELVGKGNASNREAVSRLVRVEMDRTLSRVGLATSEEVATLQARVDALERELRDERAAAGTSSAAQVAEVTNAEPAARALEQRKPIVAKKAKATVVKKAPVVKKEPTVKAARSTSAAADVPVAPKKVTAKKTVKKAVPGTGATP
jgi:polyhydroxyalkanoate synthesis regulator phasin